eukprot:1807450-Prymnesium_polylepis.1
MTGDQASARNASGCSAGEEPFEHRDHYEIPGGSQITLMPLSPGDRDPSPSGRSAGRAWVYAGAARPAPRGPRLARATGTAHTDP